MEFDDAENEWPEDDGPLFAWLPPEDRLWRHPSEMRDAPTAPHRFVDAEPAGVTADGTAGGTATLTRPGVRVWTLALAAGLAGALFASGFFMATGISDHRTVLEKVTTPATTTLAASPGQADPAPSTPAVAVGDWPAIASTLAASIVAVRVGTGDDDLRTGSGVLYDADKDSSYVLTARNLVVGRSRVEVAFNDGTSQPARVVGSDALSGIAVLATAGVDHSFPQFGTVSDVEVAEQVLAEGTRVANASPVVTGAISGLDETVPATTSAGTTSAGTTSAGTSGAGTSSAGTSGSGASGTTSGRGTSPGATMDGMLALSGVTVPATSDGGALVAPTGEVVGIDTDLTGAPSSPDVAYAVPIDVAEHVATQLLAGTTPTHPWIGVQDVTDLADSSAEDLGVSGGAQIGAVESDSPAAVAGLQPNDIITSFDGRAVPSSGALVTLLSECQPGQTAALTVYRQDKRAVMRVTLAEQPAGS